MYSLNNQNCLPEEFYRRNVLTVAPELLGKILVRNIQNRVYKGKIVEVEAYGGESDEAAHSFAGPTKRNSVMFHAGGLFYVYFIYGVHFCCNVVTGKENEGSAVLIRGIEPLEGMEYMANNRYGRAVTQSKEYYNLTNGPAKICKAFEIDDKLNGEKLDSGKISIINGNLSNSEMIMTSNRIGISKAKDLKWRFYIRNNPFISRL